MKNFNDKKFNNFKDYAKLLYSIRDFELFEDFLLGVSTISERNELVRRVQIVELLLRGETHQDISEKLHVGVSTVTRGSKELSLGRFKFLREKK